MTPTVVKAAKGDMPFLTAIGWKSVEQALSEKYRGLYFIDLFR